jgi:luciferase family oxidoreductase group 1
MLEALHPGRVDLGIGRAPGTDPLTATALRRGPELLGADDFPEQMTELMGYFDGRLPEGHRFERINAVPARGYKPALWMLGSSTYGASAAAVLGLPYSFAYHFAPAMLDDALAVYRRTFRPSADLDAPYVMLGVTVICGESDDHAHWLAAPGRLAFLRLRQGRPDVYPSAEEAAEYSFTPFERQLVDEWTRSHVIGDVDTVRPQLDALVERTGVDELMITTMAPGHDERLASYARLADAYALTASR